MGESPHEPPHAEFLKSLSEDDGILIILRDELYGGSWDRFVRDLEDRLKGRPHVFKLVNQIEDDLARIEKLRRYETDHHVNLRELMPPA